MATRIELICRQIAENPSEKDIDEAVNRYKKLWKDSYVPDNEIESLVRRINFYISQLFEGKVDSHNGRGVEKNNAEATQALPPKKPIKPERYLTKTLAGAYEALKEIPERLVTDNNRTRPFIVTHGFEGFSVDQPGQTEIPVDQEIKIAPKNGKKP